MKDLLRIVSFGLLLAVLDDWIVAAPAPPRLEELAPFRMDRSVFESMPRRWSAPGEDKFGFFLHDFDCICGLTFSSDGKTLYTTISGRGVWIWDVSSRKCTDIFEPKQLYREKITGKSVFGADGKTAACLSDRQIVLWDVATRKLLGLLNEEPDTVLCGAVFSPDGKTLSTAIWPLMRSSDELHIWDIEKKKIVQLLKTPREFCKVEADSRIKIPLQASIHANKTLGFTLLDAFTGQTVLTCEWTETDAPPAFHLAMNRAETMVASASIDLSVQLWDRNTGQRLARFKPLVHSCTGLAFSPDGAILAATYHDFDGNRKLRDCGFVLYDVHSGKIRADVKQPAGIGAWAFSPDGRFLAVKSGKEIKVWRIPYQWRRDR